MGIFRKCPDLDLVQTTFRLAYVLSNAENDSLVNLYYKMHCSHSVMQLRTQHNRSYTHGSEKITIMTVTRLHSEEGYGAPRCVWQQFLSRLLAQLPSWTAVSSGGGNGCISEGDTDTLPVKLWSFGGLGFWQASPAYSMTAHFPSMFSLLLGFLV